MAASSKPQAHHGSHTAGIFADMSIDGPVIGTLVAVFDRAKNLPNRKTIGKQDPYCAARLGKEAKKTSTDIRGGQTPKWDQELRFTVHDSPDYYQLKISIFNDDKKTDLIGEAWVDLKAIIVPGGGQNDTWQSLSCRGKYAGDIRIEITYYDSRPKPDKPAAKARQTPAFEEDMGGSARQRTPRRRPLPSDPVTGEVPSPPASAPPQANLHHQHFQTPPRSHGKASSLHGLDPMSLQAHGLGHAASRPGSDPFVSSSPHPHGPTGRVEGPRSAHHARESLDVGLRHLQDRMVVQQQQRASSEPVEGLDARRHQPPRERPPSHLDALSTDALRQALPLDAEQPPPPPAHRSKLSHDMQELAHRGGYDLPQRKPKSSPVPLRHDVLRSEAQRQSLIAYPGRPVFRPYDSAPAAPIHAASPDALQHDRSLSDLPPANALTRQPHRSMQATVEDVPEFPCASSPHPHGHVVNRATPPVDGMMFTTNPHAAPPGQPRLPPSGSPQRTHTSPECHSNSSHHVLESQAIVERPRTWDVSVGSAPLYLPYSAAHSGYSPCYSIDPRHPRSLPSCDLPDVPASLSPGIDPQFSQEISRHIYQTSRPSRYPPLVASPTQYTHSIAEPPAYDHVSQRGVPTAHDRRYDAPMPREPERFSPDRRPETPPTPEQRLIRRKSVSPAPSSAGRRRVSSTPFGPESYDALNPSVTSPERSAPTSPQRVTSNEKIITHDGREIDPTDHLPMESWAPEPEPKHSSRPASPERRARASPSGAQPMPPSGRKALRVARPPEPGLEAANACIEAPQTSPTPASAGRSRLQKRAGHRLSAAAPSATSSPLAPVATDNWQSRRCSLNPTGSPRHGGSWDYPSENHHHMMALGSGPPLPAKVPLAIMSGSEGFENRALMEEMQRIDIGLGRSTRRGGR